MMTAVIPNIPLSYVNDIAIAIAIHCYFNAWGHSPSVMEPALAKIFSTLPLRHLLPELWLE